MKTLIAFIRLAYLLLPACLYGALRYAGKLMESSFMAKQNHDRGRRLIDRSMN